MDIKELFENEGIRYWTSGKNVSSHHINIQCPFCGDRSNHLGINLKNISMCNCWKCGPKNLLDIIVEVCDKSYKEAKDILKNLDKYSTFIPEENKIKLVRRSVLPKEASDFFPAIHLKYLKERGFRPKRVIRKYKLKACYLDGDYRYRIIIPIYQKGKLVSFTGRDITEKQKLKYKTASAKESRIDPKEIIFNLDSVNEYGDAFCVEGPFDVMKIGDGAFCFMGIKITPQRILEIAEKKIQNLYIFYDNDAPGKSAAKRISKYLSPVVKQTHILKYTKTKNRKINDPANLTREEVLNLKKVLNFK